jgi:choline dehydrogenase-like flavoprotein
LKERRFAVSNRITGDAGLGLRRRRGGCGGLRRRRPPVADDARCSHRLIEAGGVRLGLTTKIPGTAFIASTSPRRNWNFETEPVPALNGRKLWWFQGRILGGSGSINGMLYLRGHSLEYDQWAQLGCHGWSFDQVLPYFKKAETNTRGANEWHGDNGPITVKPSRLDRGALRVSIDGTSFRTQGHCVAGKAQCNNTNRWLARQRRSRSSTGRPPRYPS